MSRKLKILVVDDDADAADSLAELFEMEGHTVIVAYSGNEAITAYEQKDFDVAFMDIMMPGKNGVESFFEIRKLRPDACVYMMTGYSVEQLVQQAVDNGAMGVLAKPVDPNKVLSMLEDIKPGGVVLIAEDDPEFGPSLCDVITSAGFNCKLVKDGAKALAAVENTQVDILILDLNLPIIDGIEVYSKLKKADRHIPTIIITGHASEHSEALNAMNDIAVTGILNKPFDPSMLLARLEQIAA